MKRIISTLIALLMLISCFSLLVFAEEQEESEYPAGLENVALKGIAYCSSMKNSNWTPPNSINNGLDYTEDWHGWEPKYPTIAPGQNTASGFKGEYCGVKFLNREYYEVHEIRMSIGLHSQYRQNVTYTIEALVEGEWQTVAVLHDSDAVNIKLDTDDADKDGDKTDYVYSSYEDAMDRDTSNYHIGAELSYVLESPITTNNVRVSVSDFAKNFPGGDVLIFPYIYEVELVGRLGVTPDIDLPEGAVFSSNAAYNSIPDATSSKEFAYPYRAIDGKTTTAWSPKNAGASESLTLALTKEFEINSFAINIGKVDATKFVQDYKFEIQAYVNGEWIKVVDGASYSETAKAIDETNIIKYNLSTTVKTNKVRLAFGQLPSALPSIYEFEANITGERTYYLEKRFDSYQTNSSAKGNLAILGKAYASANILPYSDPAYINDGRCLADSNVWFPGNLTVPVSCGVKLDKAYTINKIVVYCATPDTIGFGVTRFNIVAKVDGVDKIIAEGEAYDPAKMVEGSETRYATIYEFPEGIKTDDIKIDFTRGSSTIPNVMELEFYSDTEKCSMFDGYPTTATVPVYVDDPTYQPDSNEPTDKTDDDGSTIPIVLGVSLCFVAAAISVASILVVLKYKKTQGKNDDEAEKNKSENDENDEK